MNPQSFIEAKLALDTVICNPYIVERILQATCRVELQGNEIFYGLLCPICKDDRRPVWMTYETMSTPDAEEIPCDKCAFGH